MDWLLGLVIVGVPLGAIAAVFVGSRWPLLAVGAFAVTAMPAAGADSAVGKFFGVGSILQDWKFMAAALSVPAAALILVLIVRSRERRRARGSMPTASREHGR